MAMPLRKNSDSPNQGHQKEQYMSPELKAGDKVYYGIIPGVVLGVYLDSQVLFFAGHNHQDLHTSKEILHTGNKVDDVSFIFISQHFGIYSLTEETNKILLQKRFAILGATELRRSNPTFNHTSTSVPNHLTGNTPVNRRHMIFKLIKKRVKEDFDAAVILGLYERVEALQAQIELDEERKLIEEAREKERQAIACAYEEWGYP
jgi:hypothetical protein